MMKEPWKKTLICLLAAAMLGASLTGCGGQQNAEAVSETINETAEEEAEPDTGDASLDNPRNQDEIGDQELLVVSFGTSYNDNRRLSIGGIEGAMEQAFPDWGVRRGFTSQIIIDHVLRRDGERIDNVSEALERAEANGVKTLLVQPTHLMDGFEYHDLIDELAAYADAFDQVAVGKPLLSSDEDFSRVADILIAETSQYDDGHTAICFMGHGTEAESNTVYAKMQQVLSEKGFAHCYIGTVEAEPSVDDVLTAVQAGDYQKVVLEPLMIVAGDHAHNDMAGDEDDSWKSVFEGAGYDVTCVLRGIGEMEAIQEIFVEHARAALGSTQETTRVADASQMAAVEDVVDANMTPIDASMLHDGTYDVEVDSSSSMFRIDRCELTVAGGVMTARMTMSGSGYGYVYPGTAEEAASANPDSYLPSEDDSEGKNTFVFPVEALDAGVPCAAWSRSKELWYDRTLVFRASSLPLSAFEEDAVVTARSLGLADGAYTADVTLSGGTGKASVQSPCRLWVLDGAATAEIVWSSANYDYVKVDGTQINTEIADGHSVCVIPVAAFDRDVAILADTTAMSQPHEIGYTLRFDAASLAAEP